MTINDKIFTRLSEIGMSQKEFAKQIGANEKTVSAWKKNGTPPTSNYLLKISEILDFSLEYLLSETDAPEDPCTQQHGSGNVVTGDGNITGNTAPVTATITRSEPSEDEIL